MVSPALGLYFYGISLDRWCSYNMLSVTVPPCPPTHMIFLSGGSSKKLEEMEGFMSKHY
jgi:hypothetical protein